MVHAFKDVSGEIADHVDCEKDPDVYQIDCNRHNSKLSTKNSSLAHMVCKKVQTLEEALGRKNRVVLAKMPHEVLESETGEGEHAVCHANAFAKLTPWP
jgi:hypothetical protein